MGLLDDIKAEVTRQGPVCSVGILIDDLSPEDSKELQLAFEDRSIPGTAILRALKARGHIKFTDHTIQRHRRGECSCSKRVIK